MENVILHALNWSYPLIADRAADIARAGYGAVLFPPPLYSDENGQAWWQVYQPKDYRVLRSHLGRKAGVEHDFHPDRNISDWTDDQEVVDGELSGLPDLAPTIAVVQEQIECLQHLVELGFDGFRADAVKHLPIEHVTAVFQSKPVEGKFVFGETLTFDKRQSMEFLLPVL